MRICLKMGNRYYNMCLFSTIYIITLSNCRVLIDLGIGVVVEVIGYSLLAFGILSSYFELETKYRKKYINKYMLILILLFSIGILSQTLTNYRKFSLLFTMFIIIASSTLSENYIRNVESIRIIAYGCILGVVTSALICVLMGVGLIGDTVEGTLGFYKYIHAGIRDKNIATMMLGILISFYIYYNESKKAVRILDGVVGGIAVLLIILSNSRGAWIHTITFFIMINYSKVKYIKKNQRVLLVFSAGIVVLSLGIYVFNSFAMNSSTYLFRYRGFTNYIDIFGNDMKSMWLGTADLFYDKSLDYVYQVRSVTGWDGSLEIAWLNILIKNGLLGVIGFILIYVRYFYCAVHTRNVGDKSIFLAIVVVMLVTSLVATYIQTVHSLFGIYSYLLMSFYMGRKHKRSYSAAYEIRQALA